MNSALERLFALVESRHGLLPVRKCLMTAYVSGNNSSAKPPINPQVIARHHVRGEPLLEGPAHDPGGRAYQSCPTARTASSSLSTMEFRFPVLDDLGDGSAAPRDHLGVPQAMASVSPDREQERDGISKESRFFAVTVFPMNRSFHAA